VLICQIGMFKEIMDIGRKEAMEKKLPTGFWALPWYMLAVFDFWILARTLEKPLVNSWPEIYEYSRHKDFVAVSLYMVGFAWFVLSLTPVVPSTTKPKSPRAAQPPKQYMFLYQFTQWAWLHMTLITICLLSSFFMQNMMQGMIWFTLPATLVIHNDSWAYACGKTFGRTALIPSLSPKKTWEGFIGAWFFTTLWAFWFAGFLAQHKRFTCPKESFLQGIECEVADEYLPKQYSVPPQIADLIGLATFTVRPIQLHACLLATFASLFAPFGGFFASGLKRAFNLKDFGDLIPGHGGMVDRMDCQLLNALFVFCYVSNFVGTKGGVCSAAPVAAYCVTRMEIEDQVNLFKSLGQNLLASGVKLPLIE